MRTISRAFRQALYDDDRNYLAYADITLTNNTVLNLTNAHIWVSGLSTDDAVSEDDNFSAVGSVIIGSATLIIDNTEETYSPYDFMDAQVVLYVGMQFTTLEKIKLGTYHVDDATYNGATITLTLLDNMAKFDKPYDYVPTNSSKLTYPATLIQIVNDACTKCGVSLSNSCLQFNNYNYSIPTRPDDSTITFREVLSWVAIIAGCYMRCDANGKLLIEWFNTSALEQLASSLDGGTFDPWGTTPVYSGGSFNPWTTGTTYDGGALSEDFHVHYLTDLYSQNIAMDDVVITGVSVNVKDESDSATQEILTYSSGTAGYVIEIDENPFITKTNAQTIVNALGTRLNGLRFRKLNVSIANDPAIEVGDVALVMDRKQRVYRCLITRSSFSISGAQTIVCGASTPARNQASRFSESTKSYVEARKLLEKQKSAFDEAMEELEETLSNNTGVYTTIQNAPGSGGGKIYYLHDAPALADSSMVWKMTAEAWAVTDDWQGTDAATTTANKWNAGMTVNGTVIAQVINSISAFFDYAHGGTLTLGGNNNTDGELIIKNSSGTEIARINNSGINVKSGKFQVDTNGNVTAMNMTAYGSLICYENYSIS